MQFLTVLLYILLALTSLFLICLVLIQRGKGGGLAGAFGGVGGSSAFGTKAGDVFTRVTMISAGIWIALNMLLVVMSNSRQSAWGPLPGATRKTDLAPADPSKAGATKFDIPAVGPAPTTKPTALPAPDLTGGKPPEPLLTPPGTTPAPSPKPAPAPTPK